MEQITLGQVALALAFIVALWTSIDTIVKKVSNATKKSLEEVLKPTNDKIDAISKKVDTVDLNATKNFLVSAFEDMTNNKQYDEVTKQRVYEQYEHYVALGGNSYIKDKFERMKKNNII